MRNIFNKWLVIFSLFVVSISIKANNLNSSENSRYPTVRYSIPEINKPSSKDDICIIVKTKKYKTCKEEPGKFMVLEPRTGPTGSYLQSRHFSFKRYKISEGECDENDLRNQFLPATYKYDLPGESRFLPFYLVFESSWFESIIQVSGLCH